MSKEKIFEGVKAAAAALDDKLAKDIVVLNIGELTPIADYFIIASAKNPNQMKAMADSVEEAMYKAGIAKIGTEGSGNKNWILLDFNDIVVHIFDEESRDFYNLERIWADAERVEL
ncbi:MAG: ribosome silencing factor [Eubacterium sp.]|nr:ribosome silencing factor [Eubacterium sp.]MCD7854376.1 ribosome silencing factor [Clostridiales bacterium]MCD8239181.1 ribosome silencing factor [Clostridiales bacterium]